MFLSEVQVEAMHDRGRPVCRAYDAPREWSVIYRDNGLKRKVYNILLYKMTRKGNM
jgi:hypothetical protein